MESARQIAALPVRRGTDGAVEVLLITSRGKRRWVIPKGWPWPDRAEPDSAAGEAWEEAGITGTPGKVAIGSYSYCKHGIRKRLEIRVHVFLLNVLQEHDEWPERQERTRAWFPQTEAARAVEEPELGALIGSLALDLALSAV
jgi:8-oxo-dGTP pyrophosphatase MutT (NUDIX family)